MKNTLKKIGLLLLGGVLLTVAGCEKFLDVKSDQRLTVPETLADAQAMIDYSQITTTGFSQVAEISTDDYYLTDADYNSLSKDFDKAAYTWSDYEVFGGSTNQWSSTYMGVNTSNTVLDLVQRRSDGSAAWNDIKGRALVFRGMRFMDALFTHSIAYDPATASSALGIPLRLDPDFNRPSVRSSVAEGYAQVINDLKTAIPLLSPISSTPVRPSRCAAYGLLARVYLTMREYANAALYADSALSLKNSLIDYNTLRAADAYPIKELNSEVVLVAYMPYTDPLAVNRARINEALYASYAAEDLRRSIFFAVNANGTKTFKGGYTGTPNYLFSLNTDELYLIRAEGMARQGRVAEALADVNKLLENRYKKGTFVPRTGSDRTAVLEVVLAERRKELLMRGLRWMDIKRLNLEGRGIEMQRVVNGKAYQMRPNDPRYAIALPNDVIALSGMPQNPR